jgi:hypothetical protein
MHKWKWEFFSKEIDDQVFDHFVELAAVECGPKTALKSRYNWEAMAQQLRPQFIVSQAAKAAALPAWKRVGSRMVLDGEVLRNIYQVVLQWLKRARFLFCKGKIKKNIDSNMQLI